MEQIKGYLDSTINFYQEYKDAIKNFSLIGIVLVVFILLNDLLKVLHSIFLLSDFLILTGLVFSLWFIQKYLLLDSSRKELKEKIERLLLEIRGN